MTKEEILAELIENCTGDIYSGHCFVTDDGELTIPYADDDEVDFILISADDWVERMSDEDNLSALPDDDVKWVVDKINKYFADKYEWYLQRQLMLLQKENI